MIIKRFFDVTNVKQLSQIDEENIARIWFHYQVSLYLVK